jgi:hypothetical protein
MPSDLEDRAGDQLAGALKKELKELPRDDALNFMRAQGVKKGTDAELAAACDAYGYHPLSLRLLSGLIARDTRAPGDIAAAPRIAARADFVAAQRHILEHSYNALPKRERALLSRIAAFRNPTDYAALSIFNTLGDEARFDDALEDLLARGLLQHDLAHNRYDLHPIIRRYAYDRLNKKIEIHIRLRDYFAKFPIPDTANVQSIEELATVIELYHHTAHAGRYNDAMSLLATLLIPDPLHYRFGTYQLMIELVRALFPDGENNPPRLSDRSSQAWIINWLAGSYRRRRRRRKKRSRLLTGVSSV